MVQSAVGSPDFVEAASGIRFQLPDDPKPIDFLLVFVGDDLLIQIMKETNSYACQSLQNCPCVSPIFKLSHLLK